MRRFLISLSLCFLVFGSSKILLGQPDPMDDPYGQRNLREAFQDLLDPHSQIQAEKFRAKFWFDEIAESYWYFRILNAEPETLHLPQEFNTTLSQLRWILENKPWNFFLIAKTFAHLIGISIDRPMHFLANLIPFVRSALLPLMMALLLSLITYLTAWQSAANRDLLKFSAKSSPALLSACLFSIFLIGLVFGNLSLACLLAAGLALIYSRHKTGFTLLTFILALSMSLDFSWTMIERAASQNELRESLSLSRNKIEYSDESMAELTAVERSILAYWNSDERLSEAWLSKSPDSQKKKEMAAVLGFNPSYPEPSTRLFEDLNQLYPNDDLIRFNLVQLYTSQQKLVAADELTQSIPDAAMLKYTQRSKSTGRSLLPPEANSPLLGFWKSLKSQFLALKNMKGLQSVLFFMKILTPWILFFIFFALRKKSSGYCQSTGEATAHSFEDQSKLAQTLQQKTELIDPADRQRFSQLARNYERERSTRLKRLSWIFPYATEATEGYVFTSTIKSLVLFSLLYWGLSGDWRFQILDQFNIPAAWSINLSQLSWLLLTIGVIYYSRSLWRAQRELD